MYPENRKSEMKEKKKKHNRLAKVTLFVQYRETQFHRKAMVLL